MKTWFFAAISVALLTYATARPEGDLQAVEFLDQVRNYLETQKVDDTHAQTSNEANHSNKEFATQQQQQQQQASKRFRHIYSLDMTIPDQKCPDALQLHTSDSLRLCGKKKGASCDSVIINTGQIPYQEVRGKITFYQFGSPDSFRSGNIDGAYVDGISITHGRPRKHIWTYAMGYRQHVKGSSSTSNTCPSTGGGSVPPGFVGDRYFCSSGNPGPQWSPVLYKTPLPSNILGDCTDCEPEELFFCVKLDTSTTDDLEVRVCTDGADLFNDEDVRIESMDFYIR